MVAYDRGMVAAGESVQPLHEALFPSPKLRAIPSFSFDYPEDWELDEGTQAIAAVHPKEPVDGFWVNVLVNHSRVAAAVDLKQAAVATLQPVFRNDPEAKLVTERLAHFDNGRRDTYLRIVETKAPDGRAIAQVHCMFFAPRIPGARTVDLFQFVGTMPTASVDDYALRVVDMVKSFRFESGPRT